MSALWVPLFLIAGGFIFVAGFFLGWQVVSVVLDKRERQLAVEREALNAMWSRLRVRFGVDRAVFLADFLGQKPCQRR